jgi:hypothetical protein
MKLACAQCRANLRATPKSLATKAKAVAQPCIHAGTIIGFIAMFVASKTDAWSLVPVSIGGVFILSLLWSWRAALQYVESERESGRL